VVRERHFEGVEQVRLHFDRPLRYGGSVDRDRTGLGSEERPAEELERAHRAAPVLERTVDHSVGHGRGGRMPESPSGAVPDDRFEVRPPVRREVDPGAAIDPGALGLAPHAQRLGPAGDEQPGGDPDLGPLRQEPVRAVECPKERGELRGRWADIIEYDDRGAPLPVEAAEEPRDHLERVEPARFEPVVERTDQLGGQPLGPAVARHPEGHPDRRGP